MLARIGMMMTTVAMTTVALLSALLLCSSLVGGAAPFPHSSAAPTTTGCTGFDCLKNYVEKPDASYRWEDTGHRINGTALNGTAHWTGVVLNMTSQTWLTSADVSRSVWWHVLVIVLPANLAEAPPSTADFATLWITGSSNTDSIPDANDEDLSVIADVAVSTNTVGAALYQVPNQPIVFAEDPTQQSRSEDAVIAWTWYHFVHIAPNPEWLLRLPMTKASVRALDTLTAWSRAHLPKSSVLSRFAVGGASKRGWTTWTVGAVDDRVEVMFPVVMDLLNMHKNLHHQFRAYGGWTFAFEDYYQLNFTRDLDNPLTQTLFQISDVYNYRSRLESKKKIVINACMDEFFLPDDNSFWWDAMPGQKDFLIVPNADHSESTGILELLPAVSTYIRGHLRDIDPPRFDWEIDSDTGAITATADIDPIAVHLWSAETCDSTRRDFRIVNADSGEACAACGKPIKGPFGSSCENLKVYWSMMPMNETVPGSRTWRARLPAPSGGRWTAFFIHAEFEGPAGETPGRSGHRHQHQHRRRLLDWPVSKDGHWQFTSGVSIFPQTYPYPQCSGVECQGQLV